MTIHGKIKIAAIITAILAIFGAVVILSGLKYIQSPFFESIYIYCKFIFFIIYDFAYYILQKIWKLFFTSWVTVWALLGVFLIIILRWLFNYHSE
ncbi:MAG: hypothetical protein WC725_01835 [Patescibacteria group bacterium]|jgi:hypothetical protein